MKAHIKVQAFATTGNYGVWANGRRTLVTDRDIASYGGVMETIKHYQRSSLTNLYNALTNAVVFK